MWPERGASLGALKTDERRERNCGLAIISPDPPTNRHHIAGCSLLSGTESAEFFENERKHKERPWFAVR